MVGAGLGLWGSPSVSDELGVAEAVGAIVSPGPERNVDVDNGTDVPSF